MYTVLSIYPSPFHCFGLNWSLSLYEFTPMWCMLVSPVSPGSCISFLHRILLLESWTLGTICTSMSACSAFCFSLGLCLLFLNLTSFSVLSIISAQSVRLTFWWPPVFSVLCSSFNRAAPLPSPPLSLSSLLFGRVLSPQHFQSFFSQFVCSSLLFSFQY